MKYRIIAGCEIEAENSEEVFRFVKFTLNNGWTWDFESVEE